MKDFLIDHLGRIIITCVMLWIIWHNAHWSVALAITLLTVFAEFSAWQTRFLLDDLRERYEQELGEKL